MGWGATLTFLPFGPQWRLHRRLLQTNLSPSRVRQWQKLQTQESRRAAMSILVDESTWRPALKRLSVAVVLMVSYGIQVDSDDDEYLKIANDAIHVTGNGGLPAGSIVDIFPFARHLPNWLVRDWPLKFAREWGWAIRRLHDVPFAAVQAEVDIGIIRDSFAHDLLAESRSNEKHGLNLSFTLDDIKGASGAIFIAGADTTWATLVVFMLCMVLYPEVQEKAHAQLDSVLGTDRLPDFADRPLLPYIDLILQEMGTSRAVRVSELLNGTLGRDNNNPVISSTVFANAHAMSRDERIYKDPESFNPDRYDPSSHGAPGEPRPVGHFGFGRRSCVGQFLADNTCWIAIATILSAFKIDKRCDEHGVTVEPTIKFTNGGTWLRS
ncbi:hypothetical protein SAPIO_CDS7275 [Scedosporium apiospermum]|uniref:Cytochrome P450 n=1 Tax=Pseudallescheria apiosperma TaxID=563466 RepID=A0A084G1I0_PSEDA|nr:uncharacterized protein SAPIO_CDS7275 [Scedosporium apiospermum]KEZ41192.1 hypothetical protein SAPIO_CDS7275 [Scedosporium apiospermum]